MIVVIQNTMHRLHLFLMLPVALCIAASYIEEFKNSELPSHSRNILLYSRHGHYLAIYANGTVGASIDQTSTDIILEMQSFGVQYKRIRRPGSYYLAIDKKGRIVTRKKPRKNTLFREHFDGSYLWYENDVNRYILALKANFKKKDKLRANADHTRPQQHIKKTQFLMTAVPYELRKKFNKETQRLL